MGASAAKQRRMRLRRYDVRGCCFAAFTANASPKAMQLLLHRRWAMQRCCEAACAMWPELGPASLGPLQNSLSNRSLILGPKMGHFTVHLILNRPLSAPFGSLRCGPLQSSDANHSPIGDVGPNAASAMPHCVGVGRATRCEAASGAKSWLHCCEAAMQPRAMCIGPLGQCTSHKRALCMGPFGAQHKARY